MNGHEWRYRLLAALPLVVCVVFSLSSPAYAQSVPGQPRGLVASEVAYDSVTLTWDDPQDDSITGYRIYRRLRGTPFDVYELTVDTGTTDTTYTDTMVDRNREYAYRVAAINSSGLSTLSSVVDADTPLSAQPTGLVASEVLFNSVTLTWDDPQDDSITDYQIFRRNNTSGDTDFEVLGQTGNSDTTHTDSTVSFGTSYTYRVAGLSSLGLGPLSPQVHANTPVPLSSLTLSPRDIIGFAPDRAEYSVGMASTVTQVTITATATDSASVVTFSHTDADDVAPGHQVTLTPGLNTVTVTAANSSGNSAQYRVTIGRGVTDAFGWTAVGDLDGLIAAGNESPFGLWGNATTLWVSDVDDDHVYAYNKDGTRDLSKEIALHSENSAPSGIWSDGETMWVADTVDDKLYAYRLSDGTRVDSSNITLGAGNERPFGIWSDGETMWVADTFNTLLYAYRLSDGARDSSKDFDPNAQPRGHWSDGVTWWVEAGFPRILRATDRDSGAEDSTKYFLTLEPVSNRNTHGIWSDGETMWVVDFADAKVYSYNMPVSGNADLSTLAVDRNEVSGFSADTTAYTVDVAAGTRTVRISAEARQLQAMVTDITPADADEDARGHQVDIDAVATPVVVTVTAQDGTTKSYTVTLRDLSVVLSEDSLAVVEGDADGTSYTVKLPFRPSSAVTVMIAGDTGTDLSLDKTSLTFTSLNWNIPQTVTVTAADDDDSADDDATLTHTASGGGYDAATKDLAVAVLDKAIVLSSLAVSPRDIIGFAPGRTGYSVGVASTVTQATITAAAADSASVVTFSGTDADGVAPGHQVALVHDSRPQTVTVTVTSADGSSRDYTLTIGRGVTDAFGWNAVSDLDGLRAAGNDDPSGLWGNATTVWVSDRADANIYAYNKDGTRDLSKEIALHSENSAPRGIWSDGETMWVADTEDDKLYAYRLSDGARVDSSDIDLGTDNKGPTGLWSDGETMWVADNKNHYLYAYRLSDGVRDSSKDFNPGLSTRGHWSDGVTWWDTTRFTAVVAATDRDSRMADNSKYFRRIRRAENRAPQGIWSDGETMWVVDSDDQKVYSYNMPVSGNADLRTLAVDGNEVSGFSADTTAYTVDASVRQVTISAEVRQLKATVTSITPADADDIADGHQVDVSAGDTTVVVTVTAQDATTKDYTVTVRGFLVLSEGSLVVDEGDTSGTSYTVKLPHQPTGTVTVTVSGHASTDLMLSGLSATDTLTFTTLTWDTEQTVTVSADQDDDAVDDEITLVLAVAGGGYDTASQLLDVTVNDDETAAIVLSPVPLSVGEERSTEDIYYTVALSAQPTTTVTVTVGGYTGTDLVLTARSRAIFHTTNWSTPQEISVRARDDGDTVDDDVVLTHTASGAEYDGVTADLAVTIVDDDEVQVLLGSLRVRPKNIFGFFYQRTEYSVGMASTVTEATIVAAPRESSSVLTFSHPDADDNASGHQVTLEPGLNIVTITATNTNGDSYGHTVTIGRGVTDAYGWKASDDLDSLRYGGIPSPFSIGGNATNYWVGSSLHSYLWAYTRNGRRDVPRDISPALENLVQTGIWTDGETMWVVDPQDDKLYAYGLSDRMRVESREIALVAENDDPAGVWTDGETMWVADSEDDKLYAYRLSSGARAESEDVDLDVTPLDIWSDGATWWIVTVGSSDLVAVDRFSGMRDSSKDFTTTTAAGNESPVSIWSDGETMWVLDSDDQKVYSYNMPVSGNADLDTLAVDGNEVSGFSADTTAYTVDVAAGTRTVTISAEARHLKAMVTDMTPADADEDARGHQVDIDAAGTPVVVTVTAQDGTTKSYTVTLRDSAPVLSEDSLAVVEGDADGTSYTVKLPFRPSSAVTVMIAGDTGTDLSLDKTSLTFTSLNWNIPQTVTVTAADDDDSADDDATLTHTASGGGYDAATKDLAVAVLDKAIVLSSLAVSPRDIIGFAPGRTGYSVGVASTVTQATITAAAADSASVVTFSGTDADDVATGHQVALVPGAQIVVVTVTSEDGSTRGYSLTFGRGVTDALGWNAVGDLDGLRAAGNDDPFGLWGSATTLWVSDTADAHVYAYNRDGTRDTSSEIALDPQNSAPTGIWSDGETIWVADAEEVELYAYRLSDGARVDSSDVTLDDGNDKPFGIWSDGETMWVADLRDANLYAYRLSDGERDSSKDFAPNANPHGHWSDGLTWWAVGGSTANVLATDRDSGALDNTKHFAMLRNVGNRAPQGVWSDGETMWVVDLFNAKVYSYNMPRSGNADLRTLAVDGTEVSSFSADTTSYTVDVTAAVRQVTISAEVRQIKATVTSITPADADDIADGHQVDVNPGDNTVVVTVTAQDATTKDYTVTLRGSGVVLSKRSLAVDEGDTSGTSYTAKLSHQPTGTVTVTVSGHASTDLMLSGLSATNTLTFTTLTWDTEQTVTVSAGQDDDAVDDTATLTHSASGGGFGGRSDDLAVRVEDDEKTKLGTLSVSPRNIIGFTEGRTGYAVGVASTVTQATITAAALNSNSVVTFSGVDADGVATGHQVALTSGVNTVTITVAGEDGNSSRDYTVTIGRGVTVAQGWKAADDLDGLKAAGNEAPYGVWGNATTLWVGDTADARIYAYDKDGTRDTSSEITLDTQNSASTGIWSDGETMWVADQTDGKLYAYRLSDGTRVESKEFSLDSENADPADLWSDGATMWVTDQDDNIIYAYALSDGTPETSKNSSGVAVANPSPIGLWSDGELRWIADTNTSQAYAFKSDSLASFSEADFRTFQGAGNQTSRGIWSDGETMWVVDLSNAKVYSYNMRDSSNADLRSVAIDGVAVSRFDPHIIGGYVVDVGATVLQVTISAEVRQLKATVTSITPADADEIAEGHQVDTTAAETAVVLTVTAEDGTTKRYTVTVRSPVLLLSESSLAVDEGDAGGASYTVELSRQPASSVTVMIAGHAGTDLSPDKTSLTFTTMNWSMAQTVTVTAGEDLDARGYSVTLSHTVSGGSYRGSNLLVTVEDDDTEVVLSSLTVSPRNIIGFTEGRTGYAVGVASTVTQATITAAALNSNSVVTFSGVDADGVATGHQVALTSGVNTVTITVAGEDGNSSRDYTVTIGRGVTVAQGWKAADDLDGLKAAGNEAPYGVWGNATTLWVGDTADARIYAYDKDGTRDTSSEITLDTQNSASTGIWSDGETMWVADLIDGKLYAYRLSDGTRVESKEFALDAENGRPAGIWSDGAIMWVTDVGRSSIYAYRLSDGMRQSSRDFVVSVASLDLWSDGVTWWLVDGSGVVAIDRASGMRDSDKDFATSAAGNTAAQSLWSDGETMWAVDESTKKAYSYNMPRSSNADLRTLAVDDAEVSGFDFETTSYVVDVGAAVRQVTISAEVRQLKATITSITPVDADADTDGHQVDINKAETPVAVTVTAQDGTTKSYTVTVRGPGLVLSEVLLGVTEEDSTGSTYTVKLADQPTATVTVTVSGHAGSDVTLGGLSAMSTLTFSTTTWDTAQTVTVTAGEDDDAANDSVILTHTSSGGGYYSSADLAVTVTDDDDRGIVFDPVALSVGEGDATGGTYTVRLATQPTAAVTVTVSGHAGSDVTLGGLSAMSTLTFSTTTWDTEQTVTVTAGQDVDGMNDSVTLTHTAAGGDYGGLAAELAVTVLDDDRGIVFDPVALSVGEGDATGGTYTVRLATQPTAAVTVTVSGHAGSDVALGGLSAMSTLTFSTTTWDTEQTVTVTAGQDVDGMNDSVTLTHTAAGGDYGGLAAELAVTVLDDDRGIVFDPVALSVGEGDATGGTYTVRLATQPTAAVTVTVSGHAGSDVTLGGLSDMSTLTFSTTTWDTEQTVTVTAGQDVDGMNDSVTLTHTAAGGDYGGLAAELAVTVLDDDRGIVFDPVALSVGEGDATGGTYTVRLATQPTAAVTVTVSGHAGSDVTLGGLSAMSTLTFSTTTWDTEQTVTVTAGQDVDGMNDSVTLTHTAAGGDYGGLAAELAVTVLDDDRGIVFDPVALSVGEGDATGGTYTVRLATQPTAAVTVTVSGHAGSDVTLGGLSDMSTLTFSTTTWDTEQTVTVTAGQDVDGMNDSVTLTHTAAGGDYGGLAAELAVTVLDDDRGIVFDPVALSVGEGDATGGTYTVRLATQPTAAVTVTVSGHAGSDVALGGLSAMSTLTFSTTTWDTEQTVTVTAGQDVDGMNDSVTLTHTAAGGDYGGLAAELAVTVLDDDRGIVFDPVALSVGEGDATGGTYTVRLATQPTAAVTVTVSGHAGSDVTLGGLSAMSTLTFSTTTWDTEQTVTVTAGQDVDGMNDSVTLTHTAAGGDYGGLAAELAVTVLDDDRGIVFDPVALSVGEGDATGGTYTVRLATQPTAAVTVTVSGHAGSDVTLGGLSDMSTLTFSTTTWDTEQTVTVTAGQDVDGMNDSVTLTHTAAGGDYGGLAAELAVTVLDDDRGIVFDPVALSVGEGDATGGTYTVRLATQPTAAVTVTVSGHAGSDVTLGGLSDMSTLTFSTTTWDTEQTVTVTAGQDVDGMNDSVTLTHTAAGGDYGGLAAELAVTVLDDDRGIVFDPVALSVGEGDATGGTYTVRLATQPTAAVTVTVSGHAGSDVTLGGLSDMSTLTFSTTTWDTEQTVTVTAGQDVDGMNDSVTLTHTAAGGDYGGLAAELAVTVLDDDRGIVFDPVALSVGEGDATGGTYTVRLATQPTAAVTVTVSGHAGSDVTLGGLSDMSTLTFSTTTWDTEQTVTVTAGQDVDGMNDSVTLTHTAAGGDYGGLAAELAVTVLDDDRGIVFDPVALSVGEGDATGGTYTVRLATQPTAAVTVTVSGHAGSDVTLGGLSDMSTLTFSTTTWDTEQTVTVTAGQDVDGMNDSVTLTHTAAGGDYGGLAAELAVTVLDDDRGIVFDPVALSVGEGDATGGTYTVRLATQPTAAVTVTVSGHAGSDVTLGGLSAMSTLTFSTTTWDTEQTVTVTAGQDVDGMNDSVTLTHTAAGGDYGGLAAELAVTVLDDDRGIVFDPVALSVGEGDATGGTYTVRLATQPTAAVTVTVSGHAGSDVTLGGLSAMSTLTFSTTTWDTEQTVTVTAGQDVDGMNDSVTLTHTAAGGDYGGLAAELAVTVLDDDRGIVFDPVALSVGEGDATGGTYTVRLATQPTAAVTVTVSGHAGSDVTLGGLSAMSTLTFSTTTWDTEQTVTVTAGQDVDGMNDSVTLTHTAAGGDYGGLAAELAVTVLDDDRGIVFDPVALSVGEGDATGGTYTVRLATQPTAAVTVTVSGHAGSDVTLGGLSAMSTLTFSTTTWDTEQTVTVTAGQDVDGMNDSVTLTHTAAGGDYGGLAAELAVTVLDDDRGIVFDPVALSVGEGDATGGTYTVRLATQPTAAVTVTVSGHAGSDVTLGGLSAMSTLTFSTTTWDTEQTVTVTAGQDVDGMNDSVTLTHTAAGGDYGGLAAELAVTVLDDDRGIVFDPVALSVGEGDATGGTYTVRLATQPTAAVTVTVSGHAGSDVTLGGLSAMSTLTFSTTTWDTEQTVTVTAGQDVDGMNDSVTLTHTAAGGDYGGLAAELAVTVLDDDRGIVFDPVALSVGEGDATGGTYTVRLATQPTAAVTVTVSGHAGSDVTLGGLSAMSTLTFSTTTWDTEQTVTVTAGQDVDGMNDSVTLTHTAAGGDYGGLAAELAVTVLDDDRGIVFDPVALSVGEGDATGGTYTVRLATQPTAAVTVTVSGHAGSDVTLGGLSAMSTLTFSTTTWDTEQTVTVTAGQDVDGMNDSVTLTHTAAGGDYGGLAAELAVTVLDDDRGIVFDPVALSVGEGDATGGTYTVRLATQPTAAVTVTVSGHAGSDVTLGGLSAMSTLTFSTTTWDTEQTVTVTAGQDVDGMNDSVTLTHTAAGGDYGGLAAELAVTVLDDDRGIVFDPVALSVGEGDATGGTYTVRLATQPTAAVTVTVSGHAGSDVTLGGLSAMSTLTFSTTTWDTEQTVTVTAGQDVDGMNDSVTLTHTAAGGDYGGLAAELAVTVLDDDRGIVFDPVALSVGEGDATGGTYTVRLATQPTAAVTVTVSGHAGSDVTLGGLSAMSTLTFSTTTWDTEQTVTVTAGQDVDGMNDSVTLTHTAAGGDYGGLAAELAVTVLDDDRGIVFDPVALSVGEGDATGGTYTVRLATQPTAAVTVTVSGHAGSDVTLGGLSAMSTLTFSTTTWDTEQTVTVTAGQDVDGMNDSVTLTHTAAGGDYGGLAAELAVTVLDDDRGIVFDPVALSVGEGDATGGTYTVRLATQPTAAVTVTVSGHAGSDVTLGGLSAMSTLTFSTTTWDTEQTVTVTAGQDVDGMNDSVTLTHTAAGGDYGGLAAELAVTVLDDDRDAPLSVSFESSTYFATEGGDDATVTVRLSEPALDRVEVPLTAEGRAGATPGDWSGVPESLIFAAGEISKSFTVTAFDDTVEDDGETMELGFGTLPDPYVAGVPATTRVTLIDDDAPPRECIAETEVDVGDTGNQGNMLPDQSGSTSTHVTLTADGTPADAYMERCVDSDWFRVQVEAGKMYRIDVLGADTRDGTWSDPVFAGMYDSAGRAAWFRPEDGYRAYREGPLDIVWLPPDQEPTPEQRPAILNNDDGGEGYNARMYLVDFPAGTYYATVGGWRGLLGTYRISLIELQDDSSSDRTVSVGAVTSGEIEYPGDTDTFVVSLEANTEYIIKQRLTGYWSASLLVTPQVTNIHVSPNEDISTDHDRDIDGDRFTAPTAGNYRITIAGYSYSHRRFPTGTYTVQIVSAAVGSNTPLPNSPAVGRPAITGTPEQEQTLSASTSGISDPDGLDDATFAYQWLRDSGTGAVAISGATAFTYVIVDADVGNQVSVRVSFVDDAGNAESLISLGVYIQPLPPLQARFQDAPASHNGEDAFPVRVVFNHGIVIGWKDFRDHSFTVTGGDVTHARRVDGRRDLWEITVEPDDDDDVVLVLSSGRNCDVDGAICNSAGMLLQNQLEATIPGPEP